MKFGEAINGEEDEKMKRSIPLNACASLQVLCKLGGRYLYNNHHSVLFLEFWVFGAWVVICSGGRSIEIIVYLPTSAIAKDMYIQSWTRLMVVTSKRAALNIR